MSTGSLSPEFVSRDISGVLATTACPKHKAEVGESCYDTLRGVCNARAKKAGFNHSISDKSKQNRVGSAEKARSKKR